MYNTDLSRPRLESTDGQTTTKCPKNHKTTGDHWAKRVGSKELLASLDINKNPVPMTTTSSYR